MERKRIAIVGTGISGLTAAWKLHEQHDITVYEAGDYIGGHTNTIDVELDGEHQAIDTGFIVHNDRTYPNFIKMMDELGVETQYTEMSFSVKDEKTGLEYNGGGLNKLFAQRRNLFRPSFHTMIRDILRFNKEARALLEEENDGLTLGEYLKAEGYSRQFVEQYITPMGSAIWSTQPDRMLEFPARTFVLFFRNHGLLDLKDRPRWKTIVGGSREYVKKMTAAFRDTILLNTPVDSIRRMNGQVYVKAHGREIETFDEIIIAAHSNQALAMLADPSEDEKRLLRAIPFQENIAVLHTDTSVLPKRKLAWASWNYHITEAQENCVALTYNMNILQRLQSKYVFNVTLNRQDVINPDKVIKAIRYEHPLFTPEGMAAQANKHLISGVNHTWYAGAYWRYGFHEDGVVSALDVVDGLTRGGVAWAA